MSHVLRVGVTDQIAYFRAYNTDGSGKADLTSATTGLTLSVFRVGLASVSIASLSDKAADNTAHADGAIRAVQGNLYSVDLPDAATANQCPSIGVRGTYAGGVIEPIPHPLVAYDPAVVAVGANTIAPLDAAGTRAAIGLAAANLDTQIQDLPTVAEFELRSLLSADYFVVGDYTAPDNAGIAANGVAIGDVPSAEEISDRIERVGGMLDLLESSALTGPNTVTITVTDSVSTNAIQSATVKVSRTGETESKTTNVSGVTTHALSTNTWTISTRAAGYASDVQTVVVTANASVAIALTPITIADPGAPGVCRLIAYVFWNDEPVSGATVSARLKGINQGTDGKMMSRVAKEATTNSSGLATLDLIQGGEFVDGDGVYVIEAVHNRNVIWQIESAMPDAASVNVEDLIS